MKMNIMNKTGKTVIFTPKLIVALHVMGHLSLTKGTNYCLKGLIMKIEIRKDRKIDKEKEKILKTHFSPKTFPRGVLFSFIMTINFTTMGKSCPECNAHKI